MDLREYEGKQLFRQHDVPIPESALYTESGLDGELPATEKVVVKAQVPATKRAEHGGIEIVDRATAEAAAKEMLGKDIDGHVAEAVLIEELVDIAEEWYLSLSINRAGKNYHLVFSEDGGSGIEERTETTHILDFHELDVEALEREFNHVEQSEGLVSFIRKLFDMLQTEDALLTEINPLVLTADGELIAADSKVRLDENAFFRHEFPFERDEEELQFVPLDGNIGVIGNGAGLVMATLDTIQHFGGAPADFLDIGGGADFETMKIAMRTVMETVHVDGMFVNIFGGITRCDEVAHGIIDFVEAEDVDVPLVVRMVGTNQEEGRELLEENEIHALDSMDACAEKVVELVEG